MGAPNRSSFRHQTLYAFLPNLTYLSDKSVPSSSSATRSLYAARCTESPMSKIYLPRNKIRAWCRRNTTPAWSVYSFISQKINKNLKIFFGVYSRKLIPAHVFDEKYWKGDYFEFHWSGVKLSTNHKTWKIDFPIFFRLDLKNVVFFKIISQRVFMRVLRSCQFALVTGMVVQILYMEFYGKNFTRSKKKFTFFSGRDNYSKISKFVCRNHKDFNDFRTIFSRLSIYVQNLLKIIFRISIRISENKVDFNFLKKIQFL